MTSQSRCDDRGHGGTNCGKQSHHHGNLTWLTTANAAVAMGLGCGARQGLAAARLRRASRNPERALGAVLVDGAYPYDWLDEAMEFRIRKLFRRMSWFTPLLRPTGLTPRMTAEQQADSNIELGRLSRERELGPVLDNITVPVAYVVASGTSLGSRGDEQERIRTSLDAVTGHNLNIKISAKVASNHGAILKKDFPAIAEAVREVAALDCGRR